MLAPAACGPDPGEGPAAIGEDAATTASTIAETFDLPFGLIQPAGVVPIGRPVVYEQDLYSYNGVPVRGRPGTQIVEAGFVISAGGWGFDVVAVRASQDPYATLYVTSAAD
jgi:hypothetical protein